jgi:hypothetical protein
MSEYNGISFQILSINPPPYLKYCRLPAHPIQQGQCAQSMMR